MTGTPRVVLTLVAPAHRCNQRCPQCLIHLSGEPVHEFTLTPEHYAEFVRHFFESKLTVRGVLFQGYEVTLPASWPYLEAAFAVAQPHRTRRSFITNGMLLFRWTERIRALQPDRIAVSLDGSSAEANDRHRGVDGAFEATVSSLGRFLDGAPELRDVVSIASTMYGEMNHQSLLGMPSLLHRMGISRWMVSAEGAHDAEGRHRTADTEVRIQARIETLRQAAEALGIRFHVNDELGRLPRSGAGDAVRHVGTNTIVVRLDPSGGVRTGQSIFDQYDSERVPRWIPGENDPVDLLRSRSRPADPREP